MKEQTFKPSSRLDVVDALRGFALLAIVLHHNMEHYNIYFTPPNMPAWLSSLDLIVWNASFFLIAGKAYATFSLLFGFSFYIQLKNERERGGDFRLRFVWRLFLLFLFSQFHALFYDGDILLFFSIIGLTLIPVANLKDKTVFIIASILLLQPLDLCRAVYTAFNPDYSSGTYFMFYVNKVVPICKSGSFLEVLKSNIWNGQLMNIFFNLEFGRIFQTTAFFMFGMLLGRRRLFIKSEESVRVWKRILLFSFIAFIPLYFLRINLSSLISNPNMLKPINVLVPSLANFAMMCILVSLFTLLWFKKDGFRLQKALIPFGRMSLTNYITQSIIGVCLYYGFGLGLYEITGATACVLIGFGIFFVQRIFSKWWLSTHKQGPLEFLWRKATWLNIR